MILPIPALQVPQLREPVRAAAEVLLGNLSLLFIPVGVGVIMHLDIVSKYGVRLLVVIVVSTWMGLAVTALLLNVLLRQPAAEEPRNE
jgi:holin-like protein